MSYPMLKPNCTWSSGPVKRSSITEIDIVDKYAPIGNEIVWNASDDSRAKVYVIGSKMILSGDGSGKIYANPDASYMFSDTAKKDTFKSVMSITGADILDTSKSINMARCFEKCSALTSVNLSTWTTSNVVDMNGMFSMCSRLSGINISDWDTGKVVYMTGMFQACSGIEKLDLSRWNVSNVKSMKQMFFTMKRSFPMKLTSIGDTSNWNTISLEDVSGMFTDCDKLQSIDMSAWNLSKVKTTLQMFNGCESLVSIGDNVSTLKLPNCTNLSFMFSRCKSLTSLDFSNWDVHSVTALRNVFSSCLNLTELDISNWDISSVTDMSNMFSMDWDQKSKLAELKFPKVTRATTNLSFMFYGCSSLKVIDVTGWDVSSVISFDHFAAHTYAEVMGIGTWSNSVVESLYAFCHSWRNAEIDLSCFKDTSHVKTVGQLFEHDNTLKKVTLGPNFICENCIDFCEFMSDCTGIEEIDLSMLDTRKAQKGPQISTNGGTALTMQRFFNNCPSLKKVKLGPNFSYNGDGTDTDPNNWAILPASNSPDWDGKWYSLNGDSFTPEEGCKTVPATLFATKKLVDNEPVILKNGALIGIGESIRSKKADGLFRKPSEMKTAIDSISTAKPEQEKTVTISENGVSSVTPDTGKVLSKVNVTVNTPVPKPEQEKTIDIVKNGVVTITPDSGKALSKVVANVNVPTGGGGSNSEIVTVEFIDTSDFGIEPRPLYYIDKTGTGVFTTSEPTAKLESLKGSLLVFINGGVDNFITSVTGATVIQDNQMGRAQGYVLTENARFGIGA